MNFVAAASAYIAQYEYGSPRIFKTLNIHPLCNVKPNFKHVF